MLLEAQDRTRWDQLLVRRGLAALRQAPRCSPATGTPVGKYFLQASIAAQHARAARAEDTDWRRIAGLYDVLAQAAPGPSSRSTGRSPTVGRSARPPASPCWTRSTPAPLGDSPLLPSVRGDLLERAGRHADAATAFAEAAGRTRNDGERRLLRRRAEENRART